MAGSPQLTLDDYKRFALQQAASAPSVNPVASALQMAAPPSSGPSLNPAGASDGNAPPSQGPMPQAPAPTPTGPAAIADPNAPPTATVTNVQQHQGPIKSFLSQFLYGAGQAMTAHVGLQTDAQKQQVAFNQQQQQATQARQQALLQPQIDAYTGKNQALQIANTPVDTSTLGIPGLTGIVLQKDLPKILVQHIQNQGKEGVAQITAGQQVRVDPDFAKSIGMPELAGQMVSGKTQQNLNAVARGLGINQTVGDIGGGQTGVFNKATGNVTKDFGTSQRIITAGMNANNRTVQVVNPNDPTSTIQVAPAVANRMGAQGTQSAGYRAAQGVAKDFTSGPDAKNLNSFNTAIAHLGQLGTAADALGNGDTQALNRISNAYATQTGAIAPTNFAAVKGAVAGEIGKVFKGGNATDQEISEMNSAINSAQSPQQLKGVIKTYTSLMNSKKISLQQQYQQGLQGKPNFQGEGAGPAPTTDVAPAANPFSRYGGTLVKP